MRNYIDLVNKDEQLIVVNEGLKDYLNIVGNSLAGLVSNSHKNKAEIQGYLISAKRNFILYMGKINQDWSTVQWKTLVGFMNTKNQFNFDISEIKSILQNQEYKSSLMKLLDNADPKNSIFANNWLKMQMPIGGNPKDQNSAKRAEITVTYYLELSVIKFIEKTMGIDNIDDKKFDIDSDDGNGIDNSNTAATTQTNQTPNNQQTTDEKKQAADALLKAAQLLATKLP